MVLPGEISKEIRLMPHNDWSVLHFPDHAESMEDDVRFHFRDPEELKYADPEDIVEEDNGFPLHISLTCIALYLFATGMIFLLVQNWNQDRTPYFVRIFISIISATYLIFRFHKRPVLKSWFRFVMFLFLLVRIVLFRHVQCNISWKVNSTEYLIAGDSYSNRYVPDSTSHLLYHRLTSRKWPGITLFGFWKSNEW